MITLHTAWLKLTKNVICLGAQDVATSSSSSSSSSGIRVGGSQDIQLDYTKMKLVAEEKGLSIVSVPVDGDCALHAIIRQLQQQGIHSYNVRMLRELATEHLESHSELVNFTMLSIRYGGDMKAYLRQQAVQGTLCDDAMIHAVAVLTRKIICVVDDSGSHTKFESQICCGKPITIGQIAGAHYVSLEARGASSDKEGQLVDQVKSSQFQDEATIQRPSSSAADDATDKPVAAASDSCAICMDVIKDAKTLPCAHVFCSQCIDQSLAYQPKCPCCGKIFGVLKGDQPEGGSMRVRTDRWLDLEGYPKCGRIVIDYYVPDGRQKVLYNTLYLIVCMSCFV